MKPGHGLGAAVGRRGRPGSPGSGSPPVRQLGRALRGTRASRHHVGVRDCDVNGQLALATSWPMASTGADPLGPRRSSWRPPPGTSRERLTVERRLRAAVCPWAAPWRSGGRRVLRSLRVPRRGGKAPLTLARRSRRRRATRRSAHRAQSGCSPGGRSWCVACSLSGRCRRPRSCP